MPTTGTIAFTQYLRPDGRTRIVTVDRPTPVFNKACALMDAGCRFEVEVLTDDTVSLTVTTDDGDIAIEVTPNTAGVVQAVDRLIMNCEVPHV